MRLKSLILVLAVSLICAAAADKWFETPYQEWGENDVQKMLRKSPWAKSYTYAPQASTAQARTSSGGGRGRGGGGSTGSDGGSAEQSTRIAPAVYIRAQWYSAKPVRMALARQVQLLNPAADLDLIDQFVNTDPDDAILMLGFDSNSSGQGAARMVSGAFARETLETFAPLTQFTTKGKKNVPLKQYVPPNPEDPTAKFVFPRTLLDGRLLIEEADKEASFQTQLKLRDRKLRLEFRFKTKEMLYKGELVY